MINVLTETELREMIKSMPNHINWVLVSECYNLSESFIREFKDKVKWFWISRNQKLSESFMNEFWDYLNHEGAFICQDFTSGFEKMNNYIKSNNHVLKITETDINMELLENLGACKNGVERFLEHTNKNETINWFELKKRHNNKRDLGWLFYELS